MAQSFDPPDIAIIGMACRFPGDGSSPEPLWKMLKEGKDAWSEFPDDRLNINGFYHPSGNRQGSLPFKGAHFIKEHFAAFDAPFFNISATEAKAVDPQQRILLEVSYEAFENAGIPIESLDGSDTSVNIGSFVKDYEQIVLRDADWSPQYAATGTGAAILANRLSHAYNLTGPSQTVDTGCSGSLVAVHNCCEDLRSGRSSLAIAGGVGMILTPATMMPMTQLQFLSPNGRCFTFSEKADGYGRGEGVGAIILKRLEDAVRDNDTVRAVIRGSRTNQDGRTPGITMPSSLAQLSNIKGLYQHSNLDANKTAYVECHGTGTQAGDPKEVSAIHQAFCLDHARKHPIIVGSIKPNIGHLEGAAGVAGLIKAVLVVERGQIPKNLHFEAPGNPLIKFDEWNVQVPTDLMNWPTKGLRRASVNCFGFGGTNAHVVIDDAAHYFSQRSLRGRHQCTLPPEDDLLQASSSPKSFPTAQLFVISSHEKGGVGRILDSHLTYIMDGQNDPELLPNYAYTLSRRSSLEYKSFIVAKSTSELLKKAQSYKDLEVIRSSTQSGTRPKIAMVFCGQGAQWFAMGRELMAYETFSNSLIGASKYLKKILESEFSLYDELMKDEASSRINDPEIAQPATTAIQIALVDLVKSSGLVPVATVGHSSGEIAAAYAAGYLTHEDAWEIAFRRGIVVASLSFHHPNLDGAMLAVGLSQWDVRPYIDKVQTGTVVIACYNSPGSVTLSGDAKQIQEIHSDLKSNGIFSRLLSVKTAYHSHHMKVLKDKYRESISDISPIQNNGVSQMFSSVTGDLVRGKDLAANYWGQNLVLPVHFETAFARMYRQNRPDIILEMSPSAALQRPVREIMEDMATRRSRKIAPYFALLQRNKDAAVTTLEAVGEVWARGYPLDLSWSFKSREDVLARLLIDLPPYPWNHTKHYWHESHLGRALRFRQHGREDFIGAPASDSTAQEPRWRGFFRLSENPWMNDHQVQKTIVYPAAGMVVMALEAARQSIDPTLTSSGFEIFNFVILKPMIIPSTEHGLEHAINAKIVKAAIPEKGVYSSVYSFTIYTKAEGAPWQENANGLYKILYKDEQNGPSHNSETQRHETAYQDDFPHCNEEIVPRQLYERLNTIGMNYGSLFQNIVGIRRNENSCTSIIRIPDTKAKMPGKFEYDHLIHPATLDAIFQTVFVIGDESMVPSSIEHIFFSADLPRGAGKEFVGYAAAKRLGFREAQADITMFDNELAAPIIIAEGLRFTNLTTSGSAGFLPFHRNLCSEIVWEECIEDPASKQECCSSACTHLGRVLIILPDRYDDSHNEDCRELCHDIQQQLEQIGFTVVKSTLSQFTKENEALFCISLVDLDCRFPVFFNLSVPEFESLHSLLTAASGLLWVTAGAQMAVDNPRSAPIQALARTIRSEDSSQSIFTLDIEPLHTKSVSTPASRVVNTFLKTCRNPDISETPDEVDYAARDGRLYVPRLKILSGLSEAIENGPGNSKIFQPCQASHGQWKLMIGNLGDIDSMSYEHDQVGNRSLGPNELHVKIIATRLFPSDLDTILGKTTEDHVGADICGKVVNVSDENNGCNDIQIGDTVLAVAYGTLRTDIIINRQHVVEVRKGPEVAWPFYSPSCMVSAYYGLVTVGQVATDDTILIHAAASCLGQTALQIARNQNVRVFAGAATEKQRELLRTRCNVPDEYIVDTSSADRFTSSVLEVTDGKGVDIVFGSSTETEDGDYRCVSRCGHVIQMSTSSEYQTASPSGATISVLKLNLPELLKHRPKLLQKLIHDIKGIRMTTLDACTPIRYHDPVDIGHLSTALHATQKDRNLGDILVTTSGDSVIQVASNAIKDVELDSKATYILVGGLGGLGRIVANLLVAKGARYLAFFSRSGGSDLSRSRFLDQLSRECIDVRTYQVDVCDKSALAYTLEQVKENMPPVKGVIQAAAVLKDSTFEKMSYDDWNIATRPKMLGSWNLHETLPDNMDFMIFLSSAAGVIGNRGQANYAAGNTFQDALAHHRRGLGLHTVSLDLGPILGAGMVAEDDATWDILKASGFLGIRLEHFKFMVERAIAGCMAEGSQLPAQIVSGVGTGGLIMQNKPADPYWTRTAMFTHLNKVDLPPDMPEDEGPAMFSEGIKKALRDTTTGTGDASRIMCTGLISFLAPSLNMDTAEIDDAKALSVYGVDSLVATNIRNWVFRNIAVKLTDMEVMGSSSIMELAKTIAIKGGYDI